MTVIYNAFLIDEDTSSPGCIIIDDGKIKGAVCGSFPTKESLADEPKLKDILNAPDTVLVDAEKMTVMPAFIDMHAHFRYPGQPQKEDLDSALKAAAAGGFGTLVLMPNTNPVISSAEAALKVNQEAAERKMSKVFQTVSITAAFEGRDTSHLDSLDCKEIPVITEDGHDVDSASVMLEGMQKAAKNGQIVSVHSEDIPLSVEAKEYRSRALKTMKEYGIPAWGVFNKEALSGIPRNVLDGIEDNITKANHLLELAEDIATQRNITIAQKAGCHVHVAHCSTVKSIQAVRAAKEWLKTKNDCTAGFKVTCEVTPHHLALCGDTEPKIFAFVNPPLRTPMDRRAVIEALRDGTADVISTDHAPHTAEDKAAGSPGFTGLETAYAVCNSVLVKQEGFSKSRLSSLMSAAPARILGLKKGLLKAGYDADIVFANPEEEWICDSSVFMSKGKASPFNGEKLTGKTHQLWIEGKRIF